MKRKSLLLFCFILSSLFLPGIVQAETAKIEGIYTEVQYTSEFFPDYEPFFVTLSIQRTSYLNLNSSYELFMTSYRIVLNTTLLAYIAHGNNTEKYILENQKIELEFDRTDLELNETDYNVEHKLTIQISAVAKNASGFFHQIPDDYLVCEVLFEKEASKIEVIQIAAIAFTPLIILFAVFFFRKRLDDTSFENISYFNMFKYFLRRLFTRKEKFHEETFPFIEKSDSFETPKTKPLFNFTPLFFEALSAFNAFLAMRFISIYRVFGIILYVVSSILFLLAVIQTIKILRRPGTKKQIIDPVNNLGESEHVIK